MRYARYLLVVKFPSYSRPPPEGFSHSVKTTPRPRDTRVWNRELTSLFDSSQRSQSPWTLLIPPTHTHLTFRSRPCFHRTGTLSPLPSSHRDTGKSDPLHRWGPDSPFCSLLPLRASLSQFRFLIQPFQKFAQVKGISGSFQTQQCL